MSLQHLLAPLLSLSIVIMGIAVMWGTMKKAIAVNEAAIASKVSIDMCDLQVKLNEHEAHKSDLQYAAIMSELTKQGKLIARVDERTSKMVARTNGG